MRCRMRFLILMSLVFGSGSISSAQSSANLRFEHYVIQTGQERIVAELGRFDVPENHRQPKGKRITLAFVRIKATGRVAGAPILYLAGGPGTSGIADIASPRFEAYLSLRKFGDVIALDQRGTGSSVPRLDCPQPFAYPADKAADRASMTSAYQFLARDCANYWRKKSVNLADYNTEASADDVKALAGALGAKQFRLFGASYGTHLGLSIIRRHPEIVERAVFGGVEGPDQTIKLPANVEHHLSDISKLIAADPNAGKLFPDFRVFLINLLRELRRRAIIVTPADAKSAAIYLSAIDVQTLAASFLGRRQTIEQIPKVFGPASHGDYSAIAALVPSVRSGNISAMGAVMDCASSVSDKRWRAIRRQAPKTVLSTTMDFPLPEWCAAWGVPRLRNAFRAPLHTTVPVLFIEGTIDPQTPLQNALEVRRGFSNSILFTVENAGHDSSMFRSSPELLEAILWVHCW